MRIGDAQKELIEKGDDTPGGRKYRNYVRRFFADAA